jgi:hypothetical protein
VTGALTLAAACAGLPAANVLARFGPPVAEHRIGQQLIMLYHYNLLTRLSGTSFPGTSFPGTSFPGTSFPGSG